MGLSDLLGIKNKYTANMYGVDSSKMTLDPSTYSTMLYNYGNGATGAQQRTAPTMGAAPAVAFNTVPQAQTADDQQRLNGLLFGRATGTAPMAADQQAAISMDAARRNANSIGATAAARGGMSAAAALRNANSAGVDAAQGIAGQAGVQRIQEQEGAQQAVGQNLGTMRGQDIAVAQGQAQTGLGNSQLLQSANQANLQSQLQMQQMNDQLTQYYTSLGYNTTMAQLMAQQAVQQLNSQNFNSAQAINAGVATGNAQTNANLVGGAIGGVAQSGMKALTG